MKSVSNIDKENSMKTAKECIFEYIQQKTYTDQDSKNGVQTKEIAEALGMQRSNVSAMLNGLVSEGLLTKSNTRPVYYQLPKQGNKQVEETCFTKLIGHNGSLRNAIQLAKAAILYPRSSLNVLLASQPGCGTSYFATLMFQFAKEKGVLHKDASFVKINCKHYMKNVSLINDDLFGGNGLLTESAFAKAQNGMLFIDNFDLLDAKQQSKVLTFLETGKIYGETTSEFLECQDIFLVLACSPQNKMQVNQKIPVTIELPELKDRPLQERFELINYFFSIEGLNSSRSIEVTRETMQALLLTDFTFHVKELELDIKSACAKAYIRVIDDLEQYISVCLSDFDSCIKRNLLKYKDRAVEIDALIGLSDTIFYDKNTGYLDQINMDAVNMYSDIQKQYQELSNRGINHSSIKSVINSHIKNLFRKYSYFAYDDHNNLEQLSKIVDEQVIHLVRKCLDACKKELGRTYPSNVFYGLCLHINSLLNMNTTHQRVANEQIIKIIQNYPKEYAAGVQIADLLKEIFELELPIEEIVLITMFLIESDDEEEEARPVLLYVMHGNSTASSLRDVTNTLTHCHNAYSYDLTLESDTKIAMEEIKQLIMKINTGAGVIVIYDMGSIKTMMDTIAEEIDVKIRYMNIPVTLVGIDIARKCSMETDIDYVYHMANLEMNNMYRNEEKHTDIIVTLCHTGEGGAIQLKRYIDQYSKLGMKTFALSISARAELLKEVLALQKTYRIHAFVGTYDPRLLGIPFISIGKIFENAKEDLDRILMFEPVQSKHFDYNDVYKYLEEQLKYVSIPKLKTVLPNIIDDFSLLYSLNEDQRIGLFMHLACLVERLLEGKSVNKIEDKNKVLTVFEEDYKAIMKILTNLEKPFKIIIDDNEIATIIMIIKKI